MEMKHIPATFFGLSKINRPKRQHAAFRSLDFSIPCRIHFAQVVTSSRKTISLMKVALFSVKHLIDDLVMDFCEYQRKLVRQRRPNLTTLQTPLMSSRAPGPLVSDPFNGVVAESKSQPSPTPSTRLFGRSQQTQVFCSSYLVFCFRLQETPSK